MNILIFAGGSGSRLWPASRKSSPKQVLKLIDNKTLLESTYDRCKTWVKQDRIFIATLTEYKNLIKRQLPEIKDSHYSLEPVLKDRGPAIGLAALIMHHYNPESVFMTMWSDHAITEPKGYFKKLLVSAENYLNTHPEQILTVGIKPTHPHTGFGYIKKGKRNKSFENFPFFEVKSFIEKPTQKKATSFLATNNYLWNSGYFIWKSKTLLDLYKQHLPEIYNLLMKIKPAIGTSKQQVVIDKFYKRMPRIEVEKGILEKVTSKIGTIEANISWNDIGSWQAIKDAQVRPGNNIFKGLHLDHDSIDTLVYNYNPKQLVTTLGTKNLAIVVTDDAILVADKNNSEDLKLLIKKLKEKGKFKKYL